MRKLAGLIAMAVVLVFGLATTVTYTATTVFAGEEKKEEKGHKGGNLTDEKKDEKKDKGGH
jgi:hypothetical protein